ncbi:MAG: hypothetical protein JETT_1149 [Candidatus Jettenia ecosi]|uniref:Uncharacterized protein n=1 Tax=Candidatus Jettenia ecosi TaxID=2494326 RepID=A0A533QCR2_9BACT|nr:MAG: hypothetical protein JETT_1149 [Candidatus Jettenia ecosi]
MLFFSQLAAKSKGTFHDQREIPNIMKSMSLSFNHFDFIVHSALVDYGTFTVLEFRFKRTEEGYGGFSAAIYGEICL